MLINRSRSNRSSSTKHLQDRCSCCSKCFLAFLSMLLACSLHQSVRQLFTSRWFRYVEGRCWCRIKSHRSSFDLTPGHQRRSVNSCNKNKMSNTCNVYNQWYIGNIQTQLFTKWLFTMHKFILKVSIFIFITLFLLDDFFPISNWHYSMLVVSIHICLSLFWFLYLCCLYLLEKVLLICLSPKLFSRCSFSQWNWLVVRAVQHYSNSYTWCRRGFRNKLVSTNIRSFFILILQFPINTYFPNGFLKSCLILWCFHHCWLTCLIVEWIRLEPKKPRNKINQYYKQTYKQNTLFWTFLNLPLKP